ncbi:MAG: helix-turn-helix domain-containing protein [Collimonas pratensis]|uniref:winged helix-turn-helix transcriptional regulator n=1 Tax=Collimonas pratensis TaxID=279113 RepID=UPI003C76FB9F
MTNRNMQVTALTSPPAAVHSRGRGRPSAREDLPCPIRDVLDRIGDAWSVLVLTTVEPGPLRFNQLRRQVEDISQRMLTVTLRHLERDGLVSRTVIPSTPPQVEYALTTMGRSLCLPLKVLADWAGSHQPVIRSARRLYDSGASEQ